MIALIAAFIGCGGVTVVGFVVLYFIARNAVKDAYRKDDVEVKSLTPCDVCAYNPPSSSDGKPCCMCPAMARMDGKGVQQ